jgi:hypothetical protein
MKVFAAILSLKVKLLFNTNNGQIVSDRSCLIILFALLGDESARGQRLARLFGDPMTEIYLWFFHGVLPVFTSFNLLLQRQDPQIHRQNDRVHKRTVGKIC